MTSAERLMAQHRQRDTITVPSWCQSALVTQPTGAARPSVAPVR